MRIGKLIKWIVIALFVAGAVVLFGRIFLLDDKGSLTQITPTENAKAAYTALGENAFTTHKFGSSISSDGYFSAHSLIYCESTSELQLTARFNESLYDYLDIDAKTQFRWELRDEAGNTISEGTIAEEESKYIYRYRRVIFENVKINDETQLYLYLCCDEVGYPKEETRGFTVHTPGQNFRTYKPGKAEKQALS